MTLLGLGDQAVDLRFVLGKVRADPCPDRSHLARVMGILAHLFQIFIAPEGSNPLRGCRDGFQPVPQLYVGDLAIAQAICNEHAAKHDARAKSKKPPALKWKKTRGKDEHTSGKYRVSKGVRAWCAYAGETPLNKNLDGPKEAKAACQRFADSAKPEPPPKPKLVEHTIPVALTQTELAAKGAELGTVTRQIWQLQATI